MGLAANPSGSVRSVVAVFVTCGSPLLCRSGPGIGLPATDAGSAQEIGDGSVRRASFPPDGDQRVKIRRGIAFGCRQPGDDDRELAARRGQGGRDLRRSSDQHLLVDLGQLAPRGHAHVWMGGGRPSSSPSRRATRCGASNRTSGSPVAGGAHQPLEGRPPRGGRAGRQEPAEHEPATGRPARPGRRSRPRPGHDSTSCPAARAAATSSRARVGDGGHARIGRQRQGVPRLEARQ